MVMPSLSFVEGWRALAVTADVNALAWCNRTTHHTVETVSARISLWNPVDESLARQHQRQQLEESDREPETPDRNDIDQPAGGSTGQAQIPYSLPDLDALCTPVIAGALDTGDAGSAARMCPRR